MFKINFISTICSAIVIFAGLTVILGGCMGKPSKAEALQPQAQWDLTAEQWKARLTPEQFRVLREKGTEPAFTGKYWNNHEKGTYVCAACALPLFSSDTKYDSKTGWPSFWAPIDPKNIYLQDDWSLFMKREEVQCHRCASHLGHVFDDGPPPTGKRYCMNSISLDFYPAPQ